MCQLLNKKQAAEYLGVSTRTLDRRVTDGRLSYVSDHPGTRVFFRQVDLDKYIKACTHTYR